MSMIFWRKEELETQNAGRAHVRGDMRSHTKWSGLKVWATKRVKMKNFRQESAEIYSKAKITIIAKTY